MVRDHGRAEDLTQEIFISALRRMRDTERPIAFKPWIYEIAKNACIDAFRRSRRGEEVSFDADDGLGAVEADRLSCGDPSLDAALEGKQQLDHLCGAFGGLSETHHQVLVMRELEGRSYSEIGERLGMSRPSVESTLFRARRRLTEEYEELVTGRRCLAIQGIIAGASEGALGARDTRKLSRHLSHCQPCRREAAMAGLDTATLVRRPLPKRVAGKVAGWLPIPAFLRGRSGGDAGGRGESLASLAANPAAAAAMSQSESLVAGVGAGVGASAGSDKPSGPARGGAPDAISSPADRTSSGEAAGAVVRPRDGRVVSTDGSAGAAQRDQGTGASPAAGRDGSGDGASADGGGGVSGGGDVPRDATDTTREGIAGAGDTVVKTGSDATGTVGGAVDDATEPVREALPGLDAPAAVKPVTDTVTGTVEDPGTTVRDPVGTVTGTVEETSGAVRQTAEPVKQAVPEPVKPVTDTVTKVAEDPVGTVEQTAGDAVGGVTGKLP
jgi:RNA polymerase sigma factor (sigma-70 family)